MSALDTLRAATSARRSVTMCMDGALQAEWDQALEHLDEAAKADTERGSMAMEATTAAVNHLDDLRDRVKASQVIFTFDAERLSWPAYMWMMAAHPPRDGYPLDRARGLNVETFYPALIRATCGTVQGQNDPEPIECPDDVWDSLLGDGTRPGSLNLSQLNKLIEAADKVINGETTVPPSARSLLASQDLGASLKLPGPGTSAPDDSTGGSRPGSKSSSTTKKGRSKAGSAES